MNYLEILASLLLKIAKHLTQTEIKFFKKISISQILGKLRF